MRPATGAVAAAMLLLAGCTASGSTDDATPATAGPTSTTGVAPAPSDPGDIAVPAVDWEPCDGGFECGTMAVPLDYDDPDGPTFDVAIVVHRAEVPAERIGALVVNPGGPGGSAIDLARSFPRGGVIGDRFDIVGFDPRGVGASTPLSCDTHLQAMYDADPTIDDDADRATILSTSTAYVDECEAAYADVLPHLGTTNVARDMDQVRRVLGDDQLSYLGYSYGTSLGQEYARLFPSRVRAMVLDGVVDHEPDGIETARAQAAGFTTAFESYLASCEQGGCGYGRPALEVIDEVIAAAEDDPIAAPGADRPATPGVVALAMARALYAEVLWGSLSRAMRDAMDGDGTGLVELADDYLGRDADGDYDGGFEIYFAVSCIDEVWPEDPDELLAAAAAAEQDIPRFGGAILVDYVRCSLWPAPARPLAPVPSDTTGLPPVVVISTTNDPATPYANGVRVAEQIPGAVLVTNEGDGHTVVAQGKPCIDEAFTAYLLELDVPEPDTVCD